MAVLTSPPAPAPRVRAPSRLAAGVVLSILLTLGLGGPAATVAPTRAATGSDAPRVDDPPLARLTGAVLARSLRPARLAFLGSSTTFGAGVPDPAQAFVPRVLAGLRAEFPTPRDDAASPESLFTRAGGLSTTPGLAALNGGIPGATARDYLPRAALWGLRRARPACVVHMIGSNDSLSSVSADSYGRAVRRAVRRIDRVLPSPPPCHVLVHSVRRRGVTPARWAEFGAALRDVAGRSRRVTFLDASAAFEAHDALGADPSDLISADHVHPSEAGHALIASMLLYHLDTGIGTRAQRRRLDTDHDGVTDQREVRRGTDPARPRHGR